MSRHITQEGKKRITEFREDLKRTVQDTWREGGIFHTTQHIRAFRDRVSLSLTLPRTYTAYKTETKNLSRIPVYALGCGGSLNESFLNYQQHHSSIWNTGWQFNKLLKNHYKKYALAAYRTELEENPDIEDSNIDGMVQAADRTWRQKHELGLLDNYIGNALNNKNRLHRALTLAPFFTNPSLIKRLDYSQDPDVLEEQIDNLLEELLEQSLELPKILYSTVAKGDEDRNIYQNLYSTVTRSLSATALSEYSFRDYSVAVGYGAIVDFQNKKVVCMLTLNPDYVDYYLLHTRSKSKTELNPAIFNLVIDKSFANKQDIYPSELNRLVRMGIIDALPEGIKVEYVNGSELFEELYPEEIQEQEPNFNPLEAIQHNEEMQLAFYDSMEVKKTLEKSGISIAY